MGKKTNSGFGDVRLERGFSDLMERMLVRQSVILRQLGAGRSEEIKFGRFVNNEKVTADRLLSQSWAEQSKNVSGRHMLVVNDSSTLSYELSDRRQSLGFVSRQGSMEGFQVHPSILLDAQDGSCYGLAGIDFQLTPLKGDEQEQIARAERSKRRRRIAFEDKQTYKWFNSPRKAIANASGASRYTLVGDREADIYELMTKTLKQGWDFVYRCKTTNRTIDDPEDGCKNLDAKLEACPISHTYKLDLRAGAGRSAHQATLDIKYVQLNLKRPQTNPNPQLPKQIQVWALQVKEQADSVLPGESPVHWILLTSHSLDTPQHALQVVQWYCWRWVIEQLFRTLKLRGLDISQAQVHTYHALTNLTTLALMVAIQVIALVQVRDGKANQPITSLFLEHEVQALHKLNGQVQGSTVKLQNPHPKESLAFAAWVIARLGGWSGYAAQRPPGPITMILGLNRFYLMIQGFFLLR